MPNDNPMFSFDADTRTKYREELLQKVRDTIEEDRAARRAPSNTPEGQAILIGGTGIPGGVSEA